MREFICRRYGVYRKWTNKVVCLNIWIKIYIPAMDSRDGLSALFTFRVNEGSARDPGRISDYKLSTIVRSAIRLKCHAKHESMHPEPYIISSQEVSSGGIFLMMMPTVTIS